MTIRNPSVTGRQSAVRAAVLSVALAVMFVLIGLLSTEDPAAPPAPKPAGEVGSGLHLPLGGAR